MGVTVRIYRWRMSCERFVREDMRWLSFADLGEDRARAFQTVASDSPYGKSKQVWKTSSTTLEGIPDVYRRGRIHLWY